MDSATRYKISKIAAFNVFFIFTFSSLIFAEVCFSVGRNASKEWELVSKMTTLEEVAKTWLADPQWFKVFKHTI